MHQPPTASLGERSTLPCYRTIGPAGKDRRTHGASSVLL